MTESELLRTGYNTGAARDHNWNYLAEFGVKMVRADVRDLEALVEESSDCDHIVHTAAQPAVTISIEDPLHDLATNVMGTANASHRARCLADLRKNLGLRSAMTPRCRDTSSGHDGAPRRRNAPESHPLPKIRARICRLPRRPAPRNERLSLDLLW
jgi:nucleoside-diphosphate-sugar epimerase